MNKLERIITKLTNQFYKHLLIIYTQNIAKLNTWIEGVGRELQKIKNY
ncbi:MAG: hypothetical protein S4CHLAM37_07980 [Chlamydiia bacterium]|nr:hypothetical protein [Chlamydiia bacterium]